jgi:YqaJ-like viral recombinase domain
MIHHQFVQGTPEWFASRAGIPSASNFDKLITSTGEPSKSMLGYAITLAGEKFAGKPLDAWEGNAYTERGNLLEDDARKMYAFLNDVEPEQVGFITDDTGTYGCSPDSLIGDDGTFEAKCLKAENHIKAILYFKKNGKVPPDYVQQTQGQLLVTGRKWCDLFFYHPDLPRLCIRQTPDEVLTAALLLQIDAVTKERDRILATLKE